MLIRKNRRTDRIGCSTGINLLVHWHTGKSIFVQENLYKFMAVWLVGVNICISVEEGWRKNRWQMKKFIYVHM